MCNEYSRTMARMCRRRSADHRAFSLLELVIVVAILGVLSTIAIAKYRVSSESASFAAMRAGYAAWENAVSLYYLDWKVLPPEVGYLTPPTVLQNYMSMRYWNARPPGGGYWNWNGTQRADGSAIPEWQAFGANMAITFDSGAPSPAAVWTRFDAKYDDASLSAGLFQYSTLFGARHYCHLTGP